MKQSSSAEKISLEQLRFQQELGTSHSKALLETAKKCSTFSKFAIFILIFVMICLVFTGKIYLDMMVMVLNDLEVIKEFLLRK